MSFKGYFLRLGSYTVPFKFMKAESYSTSRKIQDLDSYRDANGLLHRNALEHVPHKVSFETPAMLTNTDLQELMGNIRSNYSEANERKVAATFYVPELDNYVSQDMYLADPEFTPYSVDMAKNVVKYNSTKFSLTGY